ncbi:unnamed protein product [Amoebophrya sp. A120]|nr:unnamed protein product [Amoebophrya sp. A120]|eukprot:GSA120T00026193001.1
MSYIWFFIIINHLRIKDFLQCIMFSDRLLVVLKRLLTAAARPAEGSPAAA